MRLLHTSDWHLGRSLHRADLRDAQAAFVDHLVETARAEKVDVVLVAGDVYDRAVPSLDAVQLSPQTLSPQDSHRVFGQALEREYALTDLLRRPGVDYATLMSVPGTGPCVDDPSVAAQVEVQVKYEGYIDRQRDEIERLRDQHDTALPADFDYRRLRGLSTEVQQRLNQHRPATIGQAARVQGVTPAAVALLLVYAKRGFADATTPGKLRA